MHAQPYPLLMQLPFHDPMQIAWLQCPWAKDWLELRDGFGYCIFCDQKFKENMVDTLRAHPQKKRHAEAVKKRHEEAEAAQRQQGAVVHQRNVMELFAANTPKDDKKKIFSELPGLRPGPHRGVAPGPPTLRVWPSAKMSVARIIPKSAKGHTVHGTI